MEEVEQCVVSVDGPAVTGIPLVLPVGTVTPPCRRSRQYHSRGILLPEMQQRATGVPLHQAQQHAMGVPSTLPGSGPIRRCHRTIHALS